MAEYCSNRCRLKEFPKTYLASRHHQMIELADIDTELTSDFTLNVLVMCKREMQGELIEPVRRSEHYKELNDIVDTYVKQ